MVNYDASGLMLVQRASKKNEEVEVEKIRQEMYGKVEDGLNKEVLLGFGIGSF